jgi:hypothetical protein
MGCPDYLAARLTGEPRLLLGWPAAELEAARADPRLLPPESTPGDIVGTLTATAAEATGLPPGAPVVAGFVDGIMGVLGSGVRQVGDACVNSGTSGTFSVVGPPGTGYPVLGLDILGAAANTSGLAPRPPACRRARTAWCSCHTWPASGRPNATRARAARGQA